MLSRHNQKVMLQKNATTKQRFALRKLTVGVASVLVGLTFAGYHTSASANAQNENGDADVPTSDQKVEENNLNTTTVKLRSTPAPEQLTSSEVGIKPFDPVKPGTVWTPVSGGNKDPEQPSNPIMQPITTYHYATVNITEPDGQKLEPNEQSVPTYSFSGDGKGPAYLDKEGTKLIGTSGYLFKDVELPTFKGMKLVVTDIQGMGYDLYTKDGKTYLKLPKLENISGKLADIEYDVDYEPETQTGTIHYVDANDHSHNVDNQTISGLTNNTVTVTPQIPQGWDLQTGEHVPASVTFTSDTVDHPFEKTVYVVHHQTPVDHTDPVAKDGKTSTGKIIQGAHESDLNQTLTRTITITDQHGKKNTIKQTATIYRDATVDDVTGEVTYGDWSEDDTSWSKVNVPEIPGYTPSQTSIDAVKVTNGTKDQSIDVTYTANNQITHVNYVDENGKIVHTDTISGQTDQTLPLHIQVPDGYHLADGAELPTSVTFGANGHEDFTVAVVKNASSTGDPITSNNDVLNVVKFTTPDGKTITEVPVHGKNGDKTTVQVPDGYHTKDQGRSIDVTINEQTPVQVVKVVADTPINNDTKPTKPIEQPSGFDDEQKSVAGEVAVSTSPKASKGSSVVTTKTDNQSKQLPQTGDQSNVALVGIGAASLLGMFGLAGLARKRNE